MIWLASVLLLWARLWQLLDNIRQLKKQLLIQFSIQPEEVTKNGDAVLISRSLGLSRSNEVNQWGPDQQEGTLKTRGPPQSL